MTPIIYSNAIMVSTHSQSKDIQLEISIFLNEMGPDGKVVPNRQRQAFVIIAPELAKKLEGSLGVVLANLAKGLLPEKVEIN